MTQPHVFVSGESMQWETMSPGVRRKIMGHGSDLMMVRVEFEAGAIGALHDHPHRQASYVLDGRFIVTIDGVDAELAKGDTFYVESGIPHMARALTNGSLLDVFTPLREDFLAPRP